MEKVSPYRIVVIALQRESERRAEIEALMARLKLGFTYLDAVDGRLLSEEEVITAGYDDAEANTLFGRSLGRSEIGCFLSHRLAWQSVVDDESRKPCLILESDAYLLPTTDGLVRRIISEPAFCWDIILLFYFKRLPSFWRRRKLEGGLTLFKFANNRPHSNAAYLVTPVAARRLLDESKHFLLPVDDFMAGSWVEKDLELWGVMPRAVHLSSLSDASTISEDRREMASKGVKVRSANSGFDNKKKRPIKSFFRQLRWPRKGL